MITIETTYLDVIAYKLYRDEHYSNGIQYKYFVYLNYDKHPWVQNIYKLAKKQIRKDKLNKIL